jgi:hypothetical protein
MNGMSSRFARQLERVRQDHAREIEQTLSKNSIYLHPDVFTRINRFAEIVGNVVHMWKLDRQIRDAGAPPVKPDLNDDPIGAYRKNGQKDFDELRSFIQDRYWQAPGLAEDASRCRSRRMIAVAGTLTNPWRGPQS